jgi:hypothetical protein
MVDNNFLAHIDRFFGRKRLTEVLRVAIDERSHTKKAALRRKVNTVIEDLGEHLKTKGKALPTKAARDIARPMVTFLTENSSGQQAAIDALLRIWIDQRPPTEIDRIVATLSSVGLPVTFDGTESFSGTEWSEESWSAFREALKLDKTRFPADFAAVLLTGLVPSGSYEETTSAAQGDELLQRLSEAYEAAPSKAPALALAEAKPSAVVEAHIVRTTGTPAGVAVVPDVLAPSAPPRIQVPDPNYAPPPSPQVEMRQEAIADASPAPPAAGFRQFIEDCIHQLERKSVDEAWWPDEQEFIGQLASFKTNAVDLRNAALDFGARSRGLRKAFQELKLSCANALELLEELWLVDAELVWEDDCDPVALASDIEELRAQLLDYERECEKLRSSKQRFKAQVAVVNKHAEGIERLINRLRPHLRTPEGRQPSAQPADAGQSAAPDEAGSNEDEECAPALMIEPSPEPEVQPGDQARPSQPITLGPDEALKKIDSAVAAQTPSEEDEVESQAGIVDETPTDIGAKGQAAVYVAEPVAEALAPVASPDTPRINEVDRDAGPNCRQAKLDPQQIEIVPAEAPQGPPPPSPPHLSPSPAAHGPGTAQAVQPASTAPRVSETAESSSALGTSQDERLLAELISARQIGAAYWLLRSEPESTALHTDTLRILIGTALLEREGGAVAAEIEAELRQFMSQERELNRNEKLLVCASAARLVFVVPSLVQPRMLEMPDGLPLTSSFLHSLEKFALSHRSSTRQDVEQILGYLDIRAEEDDKSGRLRAWWTETGNQSLGDFSCAKVWRKICASALQACVEAALIQQSRPDHLNQEPWTLNGPQQVRAYCRRIGADATSDFSYGLLDATIKEAKNLIRECAAATERRVEAERRIGHNGRGLLAIRSEAASALSGLRAEWEAILRNSSGMDRAATLTLIGSLEWVFEELLRIPLSRIAARAEIVLPRVPSIEGCLESTLLLFPDLDRDPDDVPVLNQYPSRLREKPIEHRDPAAMCREWIRAGGFDSARNLAALIPDENVVDRLHTEISDALPIARSKLIRRKQELSDMLELRFLDECISETERAELESVLSSVEPGEVAQFQAQHRRLDEVRDAISAADARTRSRFSERWDRLRPDLDRVDATDEKKAAYCRLVEANIERASFRSLDELFSFLKTAADEGGPLDPVLLPSERADDPLDVFLKDFKILSELAAASPSTIAATVGETGRQLLEKWMNLNQLGPQNVDRLVKPVTELLTSLGFVQSKGQPPAARPEHVGGVMVLLRVPMSINHREARPFWQFGSRSKTTNVLLIWPGQSSIFNTQRMIREILDRKLVGGGPGLLVLYFGRLVLEKRRLRTDPHSDDVEFPVALLDDILLLHLARLAESRAATLLRCSLPFAAVNPYIDAGQVPQEMFFGRAGQAASLQRYPGGQSIIYGGRQLGKSALLDQVEREINDSMSGAMAIVKDIKSNFAADGGSDPTDLWQVLLGEFRDRELVAGSAVSKVGTIHRYLTEAASPSTGRSILVLLDEADHFLMADQKNGFRVVSGLRELVRSTEGRLRFVFAGLSTVSRFQGTPNNPLVQFGEPLCIGPLLPGDARDLVMEPLRACGLRFEHDEDVLLILGSTNYHTKLIQYFCKRLVRRMHEKQFRGAPPYVIRRSDIEAVSQARAFGDELRKIFDATVRVDIENRYRAVVLALAYDLSDHRKPGPRSYTPQEVADSVRNWWKDAFPNGSGASDDLQCLLTEMCGMGLLIRDRAGKHRLRSPNLVRLLGDRNSIETQLLELENAPIRLQADSESARGQLNDGSYSCFTYVQERGIRQAASGLVLVTGSAAHGLGCIRESLRRAGPNLDAPCEIIPHEETHSPSRLREWFNRKIVPMAQKCGAVTCVSYLPANDAHLAQFVEQGTDFCGTQGEKKDIRVVFVLPPKALLDWLRLPTDLRGRLEGGWKFVADMHRWNAAGIRQRLFDCEMSAGESEISEILAATGGWHILIEEVYRRLAEQRDLSKALTDVRSQWERGPLRKELRVGCALDDLGKEVSFIHSSATPGVHGAAAEVVECLRRLDCLVEDASGVMRVEPMVAEALRRP